MTEFWTRHRRSVVEGFAIGNLAFLAVDVYIAHSSNAFRRWEEWIPFGFSILAPAVLVALFVTRRRGGGEGADRVGGTAIAAAAITVGIVGMLLHLRSTFFAERTIRNLVYTAPFVAPLSYAGLGFLLLLNRREDETSPAWGQWLIFLALGGFVGNFVLALCDHAQNHLFYAAEWIPVVAAALGIGCLSVALLTSPDRRFLNLCFVVMAVQVPVGLLGAYYHLAALFASDAPRWMDRVLHGAPVFAPLLFPNLAILAAFGLWDIHTKTA